MKFKTTVFQVLNLIQAYQKEMKNVFKIIIVRYCRYYKRKNQMEKS